MAKCATCNKVVTKKTPGVQCNKCSKWYHASCASLSTDQLCALSVTDSIDWKCRGCVLTSGGRKQRISVILPDPDEEESEAEMNKCEQDKVLIEIRHEIRQLRQTVKEIIRDELQTTLKFYSDKIDEYESKMKDFETRFKILENQHSNTSNAYKNLTLKNEVLEQKIHKIEQMQTCNDVEVCGITETENEDIKKIATTICQVLNQQPEDIIQCSRKKKPHRPGSAQAERAKVDSPITITLREGKRDYWCDAAKSKKITIANLGGEGDNKVYLRESLSPLTAFLLWKTKKELKEKLLCKYVWCKNGQIMVRKKDGDKKIYYVRAETDIGRIGKELQKNAGMF